MAQNLPATFNMYVTVGTAVLRQPSETKIETSPKEVI